MGVNIGGGYIKRNAGNMAWTRRLFEASWRLALLFLPWQTRWFLEGPSVNGFPWENGRISLYLSWIPLIVTIMIFLLRCAGPHEPSPSLDSNLPLPLLRKEGTLRRNLLQILGIVLLILPSVFSI